MKIVLGHVVDMMRPYCVSVWHSGAVTYIFYTRRRGLSKTEKSRQPCTASDAIRFVVMCRLRLRYTNANLVQNIETEIFFDVKIL